MYCRNFWDCFGSFFLFYIIKSGFFGVNGLPQVHRYGFYSVSAHFDPLRPPLGSLSDPRRHTLLSHGLCFKMHWKKKLFIFQIAAKSPFMKWISKSWAVLILAKSGQFKFIVEIGTILGDFGRFWAIFEKLQKIGSIFFANFVFWPSKNHRTLWIRTNSNWHDLADIKTAQLFEIHFINGDLAAIWKMNSFFFNAF